MSSTSLPKVKAVLRKLSMAQAQDMLHQVLPLVHSDAVRQTMMKLVREAGVERLIRPSKTAALQ